MFLPHTDADRDDMLQTIGVDNFEDLFRSIPSDRLFPKLDLPDGITEMEALAELQHISDANETTDELISFLGAGAYNHYSPAAVDSILRRGEFYTAYTPYQPEISQGTLQTIFEYQSMIVGLTGMDVSNASHYDGATAVAEAVNMAHQNFRGRRNKVVLSPGLNPQYRETVSTYIQESDIQLRGEDIPLTGNPNNLIPLIDKETALVVVQYPDFYGRIHDFSKLVEAAHKVKSLVAVHVNPLALGLLKPPGDFGADIVTGEGQTLGLPLAFGGPYLGIFATRKKYVRKMAGRIAGETVDGKGQRGYVLTLSTREQHIRRERASSNICTNQGLVLLAATIYMSLLGKNGLRQVAELNYHKAHYAAEKITAIPGFELVYDTPFFNEFTVRCPRPAAEINKHLLADDIIVGYDLGQIDGSMNDQILIAVTEMNSRPEIEYFAQALSEESYD
ncbi:MAG: aminomethyl-transferring glycine dehydrogenase subunit GcvPA [Chloroflexota bacterium]|nr:aminomethyl-transferring glycine dehydrogenase subunit GcvPA [Chloroflexota bacterium]